MPRDRRITPFVECVKYLVDNQVPSAPARVIEVEFGEEAVPASDIALRTAADADLWTRAGIYEEVNANAIKRVVARQREGGVRREIRLELI